MTKVFRIILIASILIFGRTNAAGETVGFNAIVSEYGQLSAVLGDNWDKIDSLSVTGPINAADFTTLWKSAFWGKLTVLNLENAQVENNTIPYRAFYDYDKQISPTNELIFLNIRHIILPDDIEEIGEGAFCRTKLEKINIPKSLRKLNPYCFSYCHWLSPDAIVIPEGVTEIPAQSFAYCHSLKKMVLPTSLRTIKETAFYQARIEEIVFSEGLERIGLAAFNGCQGLKSVKLPNTCLEIEGWTFSSCYDLEELQIPEGIKVIPTNFASSCIALKNFNFPKSVETIEDCSFQAGYLLKNIKLPEGLKTIEYCAFDHCDPDSIVFPESMVTIENNNCETWANLKKIYSKSPVPPYLDVKNFNENITPKDIPVYVPIGSAEKYRIAYGWNYFTNYIEIDNFPEAGIYGITMDTPNLLKVYWANGNINIVVQEWSIQTTSFSIYTVEGRLIAQGSIDAEHTAIPAQKGIYIVRVGKSVFKVG